MKTSTIEKQLGIESFVSEACGIGGVIKFTPEDFIVEEVLIDGNKAELDPVLPLQVVGDGRYLICLLVKRNWDTLLSVREISRQLGISDQRIRIAGIKDKKALTAQHISFENVRLERLKRVCTKGIQLYPLRYSSNMVYPHMLFGNFFRLTLRDIKCSAETIRDRVAEVMNQLNNLGGVPNFFGHQRFGTIRPITHLVGKALVQNNLRKATFLFLAKSSPYEHPQSRNARKRLMETEDFKGALDFFPRRLLYERLMLQHLAKYPKEYVGAFKKLPKRLFRLFLQAYQSYLFNRFLSQRLWQKIPLNEPQNGDYVVKTDSHGLPARSYIRATSKNLEELRRAVKKREMYIAIPLVGLKQDYSEGIQGEIEQTIIESEEINQTDFHLASIPKMKVAGALRKILTPIIQFRTGNSNEDELNAGKRKLQISFTLHRGSYATIVLREFMKPLNLIKSGF